MEPKIPDDQEKIIKGQLISREAFQWINHLVTIELQEKEGVWFYP